MQVRIDEDRCRGHGMCVGACPKVFDIGDGGYAVTLVTEVPSELHAQVRTAAIQCPERAISIDEQSA